MQSFGSVESSGHAGRGSWILKVPIVQGCAPRRYLGAYGGHTGSFSGIINLWEAPKLCPSSS